MMGVWKITGWDGTTKIMEGALPGFMEPTEVVRTLQRLACRHLSGSEIIAASLRKNAKNYAPLLEQVGSGFPIQVGINPYYIATPANL